MVDTKNIVNKILGNTKTKSIDVSKLILKDGKSKNKEYKYKKFKSMEDMENYVDHKLEGTYVGCTTNKDGSVICYYE